MKKILMRRLIGPLLMMTATAVMLAASNAGADTTGFTAKEPKVGTSLKNSASMPLREIVVPAPKAPTSIRELTPRLEIPRLIPSVGKEAEEPVVDTAVQGYHPLGPSMPATVANFEGINNISGVLPPDTVGDVGPNHYVQMVNSQLQVWDKSGTSLAGPVPINSLWSGFGGACESNNDGDPIVLYDQAADRWLLSQFALNFWTDFHECIAISQTPDPTGAYWLYDFLISNTKMNDYPHFGVWPDGYYMAVNQFTSTGWGGQGAIAFERDNMLSGQPAQMIYFDDPDPGLGGMLPADWDGSIPPPAGAPNLFTQLGTSTTLDIWEFHVDWVVPANSTFSSLVSPVVTAYDTDMCGGSTNCIPQPAGGTAVDAIADRLMHRVQYRNFSGHESMVTNHTVDANGSDLAGVRWYELRNTGGAGWAVHQQGTYAPDTENRWMGSVAMDAQGNIAVGYSISSASTSPSIGYAGRLTSDPLNTLPQAESVLIAGSGYQTHASGRWGDYSSMNVDPLDDCTFWYTQEYYASIGSAPWQTRIGSFKFPGCAAVATGTLTGTVTSAADGMPIEGVLIEAGSLTTTTNANGVYNFEYTPAGTYDVTASAWTYVHATVTGVVVIEDSTTTQDFTLNEATMISVSGTVDDGSGQGWPLYARIDIAGAPVPPLFTDPVTGTYSTTLPQGSVVTFNVSADGYLTEARGITVPASASREDFSLLVDGDACSAPGYATNGINEHFETFPPSGWTVVDDAGNGVVWTNVAGSGETGNYTGGAGDAASVSSDIAGVVEFDTQLVTPVISVVGGEQLKYLVNYQNLAGLDFLDLDINIDSAGWVNLLSWNEDHGTLRSTPGELVNIDLSGMLAAATSYQLRWHYYDPNTDDFDWYAQVDDVLIGSCTPNPVVAGLLTGNVYDINTSDAVNGAIVSDVADTYQATSMATPDDPNLDDGFYRLALHAGSQDVGATALAYGTDVQTVVVRTGAVLTRNFSLPAGLLITNPSALNVSLAENTTETQVVTLENHGGVAADYRLAERNYPYLAPAANGPWAEHTRHASPKHLLDSDARLLRHVFEPVNIGTDALPNPNTAGDVIDSFDPALTHPWGIAFNTMADDMWVSDPLAAGGDDQSHQFLTDGTATGSAIDNAPWVGDWVADGAYDSGSNKIWQVNVGGDNCIHESDPVTMMATGNSICPAFGTSERGLAYDPRTDTFYAGSWNDDIINHFDRDGTILDSVSTGLAISGLAFNPDTGHLFVISNAAASVTAHDVVVLDVNASYAPIASFYSGMDDFSQAGLEIDCEGHLWAIVQPGGILFPAGQIVEIDSGEATACAYGEIDWLSESPLSGTVAASGSEAIDFIFDSTGLSVGTHEAHIQVQNDTPYGTNFLPVILEVRPNVADLVVTKTDGRTSVLAGSGTTYTIGVTNTGPEPVTGATVNDVFAAELLNPVWSCLPSGGAVCDTSPQNGDIHQTVDIPVGGSVTYTATVQVDLSATGTLLNTATVVSPIPDSNPGDESATDETSVEPSANLVLTKTDGKTLALAGTETSYTITATNHGPDPVLGAVVTDIFSAQLLNPVWMCTPSGGAACTTTLQTGNINDLANLPVGASVTYSVNARIQSGATGILSNEVQLSSSLANPGDDSALDNTSLLCSDTDENLSGFALVDGDEVVCDVPGSIGVTDTSVGANASLNLIGSGVSFSGIFNVTAGGVLSISNP